MYDFIISLLTITLIVNLILLVMAVFKTIFRRPTSKKSWKRLLIGICVMIALFVVAVMTNDGDDNGSEKAEVATEDEGEEEVTEQKTEEPASATKDSDSYYSEAEVEGELKEIDSNIVEALIKEGYTVEQATEIQKILITVGINEVEVYAKTGEAREGLNAMSCYANGSKEDESRFTITTEDGVAFYVGFLSEDLYDTDKGGYLKNYNDVHVPETEVDMQTFDSLQLLAVEEVKSCLNYPETADFETLSWAVGRSDDNYKIIGTVHAKNGFGVEDEIYFGVWFVAEGDSFICEGIMFDGVRVK